MRRIGQKSRRLPISAVSRDGWLEKFDLLVPSEGADIVPDSMLVPVLIFLVCFCVGVIAAARWLPDLAAGPIGGLAFFAVVGLFAAALSVAGLYGYLTVTEITNRPNGAAVDNAEILAGGIRNALLDAGTLVGLAGIVYLLAPPSEEDQRVEESPSTLGREA